MGSPAEILLGGLGLSGLEAEVYIAVLSNPGSTGYRVSQLLGKAAPNVYKALNSLVVKGAVLPDDGDSSRTYAALSVSELASRESERISGIAREIERELSGKRKQAPQEGLYSLSSISQVFARAESMIDDAAKLIVLDGDTEPVKKLSSRLELAAARGVKVLIHGRKPLRIEGCMYIPSVSEGWKGEFLVLVSDARQYLISFMSQGMRQLHRAVWSSNFVAPCMHRSYLGKALFYRTVMRMRQPGITIEELRRETAVIWDEWGYGDFDGGALAEVLKKTE